MKIFTVIFALMLAGWLDASDMRKPLNSIQHARQETIVSPLSASERARLEVLDNVIFVEPNGPAGVVVFYDDITTQWDVDYIEVYDVLGELLLVSWIDRFGICQAAVDRGLLDPVSPKFEGVLVRITLGAEL